MGNGNGFANFTLSIQCSRRAVHVKKLIRSSLASTFKTQTFKNSICSICSSVPLGAKYIAAPGIQKAQCAEIPEQSIYVLFYMYTACKTNNKRIICKFNRIMGRVYESINQHVTDRCGVTSTSCNSVCLYSVRKPVGNFVTVSSITHHKEEYHLIIGHAGFLSLVEIGYTTPHNQLNTRWNVVRSIIGYCWTALKRTGVPKIDNEARTQKSGFDSAFG